jgi:two-component system nitrogen regulation response regulator GlnG
MAKSDNRSGIWIVDDDRGVRFVLAEALRDAGMEVREFEETASVRKALQEATPALVVTDVRMPGDGGLALLDELRAQGIGPVIVMSAYTDVATTAAAYRAGAVDYLAKPFDLDQALASVQRALAEAPNAEAASVVALAPANALLGESAPMREVFRLIGRVAASDLNVLITGETGTGKELVARAIHDQGRRHRKPLIAVNCAAFTETLLESELFGHERGAFTGAERNRQGLFEAAHEGTLFLDEIAEMSLPAQAKLLRVLTDGQIVRLGSTSPRQVNVRVIAATHRDLQQWVRELRFREDLYYRLAVLPIAIPPLRERREDIPVLCDLFFERIAAELKQPLRRLSAAALERLQAYDFPGNVRELRNLIERACILSSSIEIGAENFPLAAGTPGRRHPAVTWMESLPDAIDLRAVLSDTERNLIARALRLSQGSQADAARRLGLSRSDLSYKLAKYDFKTAVSSN